MKVFTYLPGTRSAVSHHETDTVSFETLSDMLFEYTSLKEALQQLQREGCEHSDKTKSFQGITSLLEEVWKLEQQTAGRLLEICLNKKTPGEHVGKRLRELLEALPAATDSNGTKKSGRPMNRDALQAIARFVREHPDDTLKTTFEKCEKLGHLEKALRRARWGYDLSSIDDALLQELLGEESAACWQKIKNLPARLIERGYAEESRTGLRLTVPGLQRVAWNILREIFKPGKTDHLTRRIDSNLNTEPYLVQGTRRFQFGDHLQIDTARSLLNALKRTGAAKPIHLTEEDFEVYEKEPIMRSATVVLLDLSKSMRFEKRYVAAKKVAMALYALVRKRYPQDKIGVIGFSTKTLVFGQAELPFLTWNEQDPYTNMEEAFAAAQKVLAGYKEYRQQIFLITDGEPTAHREQGAVFFQFPPHPRSLQKTLLAIDMISRKNISLSIFLLAREKDSVSFMHNMARRAGGKLFHIHPSALGRCMLMDYLERKSKWI